MLHSHVPAAPEVMPASCWAGFSLAALLPQPGFSSMLASIPACSSAVPAIPGPLRPSLSSSPSSSYAELLLINLFLWLGHRPCLLAAGHNTAVLPGEMQPGKPAQDCLQGVCLFHPNPDALAGRWVSLCVCAGPCLSCCSIYTRICMLSLVALCYVPTEQLIFPCPTPTSR